jgi:hypothetical protein
LTKHRANSLTSPIPILSHPSQEFFIDRKPNFFPLILDYLRSGRLDGDLGLDPATLPPWEQKCLGPASAI